MLPGKSARRAARTLCAAFVLMGGSAVACSGDDGVVTSQDPGKPDSGSGVGGAPVGGNAGAGGGSFGASGASGTGNGGAGGGSFGASGAGGGSFGASGAAGNGGFAGRGSGGAGGSAGSGPDASAGGTGGFNTCNPSFCPNTGAGTPCCVTGNGPCGMDIGQGCIAGSNPGRDR